jgi:hypothetical protein
MDRPCTTQTVRNLSSHVQNRAIAGMRWKLDLFSMVGACFSSQTVQSSLRQGGGCGG